MKKKETQKFKVWFALMKKVNLIKSQKEFGELMGPQKPLPQPFISAILGKKHVSMPEYFIPRICNIWPFTNKEFFAEDSAEVFDYEKLVKHLCETHKLSIREMLKRVNSPRINSRTSISKIHDKLAWDDIFRFFNRNFGYKISINIIEDKTGVFQDDRLPYPGKSDQVRRLWRLAEKLIEDGFCKSEADFCKKTGIPYQSYVNTRSWTNQTDVSSSWLFKIGTTFENVSIDWILFGWGNMYREGSSVYIMLKEIQEKLNQQEKIIQKIS